VRTAHWTLSKASGVTRFDESGKLVKTYFRGIETQRIDFNDFSDVAIAREIRVLHDHQLGMLISRYRGVGGCDHAGEHFRLARTRVEESVHRRSAIERFPPAIVRQERSVVSTAVTGDPLVGQRHLSVSGMVDERGFEPPASSLRTVGKIS